MYGMSVSRFQTVVSSTVEPFPLERAPLYPHTPQQKAHNIMQKVWLGLAWLACGPDNYDVRSCPIAMQTEYRIFNRHQG